MTLPLLPSLIMFAAEFGSLAAQKGMTWDPALAALTSGTLSAFQQEA